MPRDRRNDSGPRRGVPRDHQTSFTAKYSLLLKYVGQALIAVCREAGAGAVFFNRDVTPAGNARERALGELLAEHGVACQV